MNAEKRKALESRGYKVFDHAGDAVGMTEEEKYLMDVRITLSNAVRKRRKKLGLSQKELATRLGTSQPRVAKIEWGNWDVSLDQLFRAYAVMGGRIALKEMSRKDEAGQRKVAAKKKVRVASRRTPVMQSEPDRGTCR